MIFSKMNSFPGFESSTFRAYDRKDNFSHKSGVYLTPRELSPPGEKSRAIPLSNDEYIAVVGGLGYIGSHTCLELLNAGYNVLVIDNLCNSFRSVADQIFSLAKKHHDKRQTLVPLMYFREMDYRDESNIRQLLREFMVREPDCVGHTASKSRIVGVIHFAAHKSVSESIEKPLKYYSNNVTGLIEFCTLLSEFKIKTLIFSSSASVYGSIASSETTLLREEHCVHQIETTTDELGNHLTYEPGSKGLTNPYGRTKWMCEALLSDLARADEEWAVTSLRYFNPIGCDRSGLLGEDPRELPTNIMPMIMQVLTGKIPALKIYGVDYPNTPDGTAIRDYIHVTDLARGHISALIVAFQRKGFRTYNLGSGKGYTVWDVVKAVEEAANCNVPVQIAPRREGDVEICIASPTRAENELNWRAEKSLREACKDVVNFARLQSRDKSRA